MFIFTLLWNIISCIVWLLRANVYFITLAWVGFLMNSVQIVIFPFKGYSLEFSYDVNACLAKAFYFVINHTLSFFEAESSQDEYLDSETLLYEDQLIDNRKNLLLSVRFDGNFDLYSVQSNPPPKGIVASVRATLANLSKGVSPLHNIVALVVLLLSSHPYPGRHKLRANENISFDKALNSFKERYQPLWLSTAFHPQDVSICSLKKTDKKIFPESYVTQTYGPNSSIDQAVRAIVEFQNLGSPYIYVVFSGPRPYLQRHAVNCLPPTTSALSIWLDGLSRCQFSS
ncbi:hypothetical protein DSO57_1031420 [Entomophthora muscae]|uniref:Uncharacterized protein n=1 Tax=Entomophthora muscae TaxID=34485 RepID=A0ACC2SDP2_9FUNG|nr:hypothetical protein DSO57_1031420 [Entomophthora muscae]